MLKVAFNEINDFVEEQINKINVNKLNGFDGVSVKIWKTAKPIIVKPITKLINMWKKFYSEFPYQLKEAHVFCLRKIVS